MNDTEKKFKVIDAFQEKKNIKQEISNFFTETSFTALTRIYKAESFFRRLAWTIVVLAMMSWLGVQCYWLLERYFQYPIEVKLDLKAAPELDFPSVTICNLNPILEKHLQQETFEDLVKYAKPNTDDSLFAATLSSWMFNESCTLYQYTCSNGRCIPKEYICDGYNDCNNNDDEKNCQNHTCATDQFRCTYSSTCRPLSYVCDGENDCPNGEDEFNCTSTTRAPFSPNGSFSRWSSTTSTGVSSDTTTSGAGTDLDSTTFTQSVPASTSQGSDTESSTQTSQVSTTASDSTATTNSAPAGRRKRDAVYSYNSHRDPRRKIIYNKKKKKHEVHQSTKFSKIKERLRLELSLQKSIKTKEQIVHMLQKSYKKYSERKKRFSTNSFRGTNGYGMSARWNMHRQRRSAKSQESLERSEFDIDWDKVLENSTFNKWDALSSGETNYYAERDDEWEASMMYAYITAKLNSTFVESSGHLIKNLIASCEFNGYQCSPLNFTYFHNHKYGNCYTFNSKFSDDPKLITRFQGPGYGLKMELFINQHEYVANLATEAGIRVLIHKRGSMPFPEDKGITIMPGRSTSVGIKQLQFSRLPPPHGVCAERGDITDYYSKYLGSTYSKLSCLKSCYQDNMMSECGCAVPFYFVPPDAKVCNMLNKSTEWCVSKLPHVYPDRFSACDQLCPQPCEETEYDLSVSSSIWPSDKYEDYLGTKLVQTNSLYADSEIDHDFTKIQIYFQDLIYTYIDQQKAYESMNLISDLGGQLGLWLGLSAITIGELCSFLFSVGRSLPNTWIGGSKTSPTDIVPISTIEPASLEDMYDDLCPEQAKYIPPDIIRTKTDLNSANLSDV
ncbi:hypothetical protein RRG08_045889 [Elysia crispata]|uniref:Uncharacterized protein n=1 Tax=Elysia crispata TaxID=231223 RepID=A0AAE0ZG02_9GAST|nr:hypothetical protein RRG08_045889 [Elysia crispata]